jgi:tetratricopeptide (TPR) repeat protein
MFKMLCKSFSVAAIGLSIIYTGPSIANTHNNLPQVHIKELSLLANTKKSLQEKKYNQALNSVNQVLQTNPKCLEAQMLRGQILLALQKHSLAVKQMNNLLNEHPNYAKAYNLRAIALHKSSAHELALDDFNTAINLDANYINAIFNRGVLFMETKQFDKALNDFEKVISLDPSHVDAMFARKNMQTKLADMKELNRLNTLIEVEPNDANNYYARSVYYFNKKMYQQAVSDASLAIELNPLFAEAFYIRGAALYQIGDLPQARANFLKSTQFSGNQLAIEG